MLQTPAALNVLHRLHPFLSARRKRREDQAAIHTSPPIRAGKIPPALPEMGSLG